MKDIRGNVFELGDIVAYLHHSRSSAFLEVGQIIGFTPKMVRIQGVRKDSDPITRVPCNVVLLERGTLPVAEIDQL